MHPHILQREKQQARRELTGDHADRQAGRHTTDNDAVNHFPRPLSESLHSHL